MRLIRTCRTRVGAVPVLPLGHCSGDLRLITPLPRERVYQRQPATEESKVLRQPPECQIASLPNTTNAAANHGLKIGAGHLLRLTFLSLLSGSTADSPLTKKSTAVTVAFEPSELLDSLTSLISAVPGEPRTEGMTLRARTSSVARTRTTATSFT